MKDLRDSLEKAVRDRISRVTFACLRDGPPSGALSEVHVKPSSVEFHRVYADYERDPDWGRGIRQKLVGAEWQVRMSFSRRVSLDAWEQSLAENPIRVEANKTALFTLSKIEEGYSRRADENFESITTLTYTLGR